MIIVCDITDLVIRRNGNLFYWKKRGFDFMGRDEYLIGYLFLKKVELFLSRSLYSKNKAYYSSISFDFFIK